jgi:hypothetical protein
MKERRRLKKHINKHGLAMFTTKDYTSHLWHIVFRRKLFSLEINLALKGEGINIRRFIL